jgi:hypothetical protein
MIHSFIPSFDSFDSIHSSPQEKSIAAVVVLTYSQIGPTVRGSAEGKDCNQTLQE